MRDHNGLHYLTGVSHIILLTSKILDIITIAREMVRAQGKLGSLM